jgi:uncharacterized repeat protein (TIGR01451 family)
MRTKAILWSICLLFPFAGMAQLEEIVVEYYTDSNPNSTQPEGTATYRVYAEMAFPTDIVTAVFAVNECHSVHIATTTTFFNSPFGGVLSTGINPAFYVVFPEIEFDSWLTIGADDSLDPGANDVGYSSTVPTDPFSAPFGSNTVSGLFSMEDGAWFCLPTSVACLPTGPNNRILLGQFTTSGVLSFDLNVQAFLGGDQVNGRIDYVWNDGCDGFGTLTGFEEEFTGLSAIVGCMNEEEQCYNPDATYDLCLYQESCFDPDACNYSPEICASVEYCYYGCGCNDPIGCNYSPDDSGTDDCIYIYGCTDPDLCGYNPNACIENGSCYATCGCNDPIGCNYNPDDMGTDECQYIEGCTDPLACGYNSQACIEDGSCYYTCGCNDPTMCNYNPNDLGTDDCYTIPGCMDPTYCDYDPLACMDAGCFSPATCLDPLAENYNPDGECDDGCLYTAAGIVFNDSNQNGVKEADELGLAFETVVFNNGEYIAITDDFGHFQVTVVQGEYLVVCETTPSFPVITTGPNAYYDTDDDFQEEITIGKNFENELNGIVIDLYPSFPGIACDQNNNFNMCYRNMGNVPISGYLEVAPDELMAGYTEVTPIDSIVDGKYYIGFEDLQPNAMFFDDIGLTGPTFELMGETLINNVNAYGFNDEGVLVAAGEKSHMLEVLCAYDPNDKQTFPVGYEEPHFIEPTQEIEYLIRFQNTGNFFAFNISVIDTISEDLDLSTFHLVANSHSVQTSINTETREVEFYFENIMLPDSNCCEPDSHGLISYFISPHQGLPHDTRIENTAHIFFDANPAIVTNTTWNTIYRCEDEFATIETESLEVCAFEEVEFVNNSEYVETYSWRINDEDAGTDSLLVTGFESAGTYYVELTTENELCEATRWIEVEVLDSPDVQVSENQSICIGDEVVLTASGAETFNWGEFGETESIAVSPTETTTYQVTGSNDIECTTTVSVEVAVSEYPDLSVSQNAEICQGEEITLNASGAEVYDWDGLGTTAEISVSPMETTIYEVTGTNGIDCSSSASVLVEVFESPVLDVTEGAEICEGEEVVLGASGADTYDWDGLGTTAEITVSPTETTTYEVTGFNEINCSTVAEVTVTVNQTPEASFLDNGNVLTASDGNAWQWYLNGEAIEGATNQTYEVLEDGNYSVEVYSEAGCLGVSAEVNVIYVGIAELNASELKLFPVPVNGNGILNITGVNVSELTNLQIIDASGRMVWNSAKGVSQIALNGMAAGNYVFSATQGNDVIRVQFVIQ